MVVPEKETLNTAEARAIPAHPGVMLETAVSPGEARHQERWRHKRDDEGTRDISGRGDRGWTVLILKQNQRKRREEKLKTCATAPPTDTQKKGLSLPAC